jgi:hypothetical protein
MWFKMQGEEGVMLKDAGAFCESCYKFWAHQSLEPKRLVHVFDEDGEPMLTVQHGIPIVVCPHCDGDVILRLQKDTHGTA